MQDVTVSSKIVTGKRVSWSSAMLGSTAWLIWLLVSVLGLLYVVVKLAFLRRFLDAGDYAMFAGVGVIVIAGVLIARALRSQWVWLVDCECPACSTARRFSFQPEDPFSRCDGCGVYCRANGLEVSEVPLDTVRAKSFCVASDRYLNIAPRAVFEFSFETPPFCAICGAADTAKRVDIVVDQGPGATNSADGAWREANYQLSGHRGRITPGRDPSSVEGRDVKNVSVPVCATHASPEAPPLTSDASGELGFSSYRYYKAFCALNGLRTPKQ